MMGFAGGWEELDNGPKTWKRDAETQGLKRVFAVPERRMAVTSLRNVFSASSHLVCIAVPEWVC